MRAIRVTTAMCLVGLLAIPELRADPLPGTKALEQKGDLAAMMVEGIGQYLDRELASAAEKRKQFWKIDASSPEALAKSVAPNRERLKKIIGVVDARVKFADIEYVGGPNTPALLGETNLYKVYVVRWPVLPGVDAEGLLLEPKGTPIAQVVAIPDATWTPEQLVGLAAGVAAEAQYARRLAEDGCRVLVPVLIDRRDDFTNNPRLGRNTNIPHREFVYRMAYEMGRHLIGYELQKVLAAVDWFSRDAKHPPIFVVGWGEGGMLSLYAGAIDERIQGAVVSGYFGKREEMWKETIDRNVWGRLTEFGDGEMLHLYHGRALVCEIVDGPKAEGRPSIPPKSGKNNSAALGSLTPKQTAPTSEFNRVMTGQEHCFLTEVQDGQIVHPLSVAFITTKFDAKAWTKKPEPLKPSLKDFDPKPRQKRQFDQLVAHVQQLWRDSEPIRWARFAKCDFTSPEKYEASIEPIRNFFWEEVIGKLPAPTLPMNPRTREIYDTPKWKGYEVTLDLYPDVYAYGILLLPKGMKVGEKRPVVVCQHGLEGRPTDVCNPNERTKYYNSFGAQLADRGYIVFAPQNPYIGRDLFRVLQRKANPLKLSLFSFIVRQHERILDWLETQPHVDKDRMAFYGLSYGGKTAVRVPAILKKYCLSICSGDFNEWIGKNVSVTLDRSYMWTIEYEMYEFDLGHTFNYAEMAYLIAPRPFMVERGHDDGVGTDEMVAYEFAKVRYMYENRLKLPDRQELEFFVGGHEIFGKGTFAFLDRHLKWTPK